MQGTRKFQTLRLLPALLCVVAILVSACGNASSSNTSSTTKAADNKQVLISTAATAGTQDVATMDPALATDLASGNALETVFTGLVSLDDQGKVQPQMAQSWQISPDKLTYTFTLRPNMKFSDGTPLTAKDVAYSLNRALDPATQSPTAPYYLRYIKDSEQFNAGKVKTLIGDSLIATNDSTIEIKISQPISFFLDTLTYPCSYIVEQSLISKYPKNWIDHLNEGGGAGPFEVKQWAHNKQISYVPNPNYYGPKPQLKELIFPFYANADATRADYLANKVDDATIPLENYALDSKRSDFHKVQTLAIYSYAMNFNIKPFDNINIRKAFALSVNKQQIVDKIWHDTSIATNHMVPEGMPGYFADLKGPDGTAGLSGNAAEAKKLFQQGIQEEGWTSVKQVPTITFTTATSGVQAAKEEAAYMQQEWHDTLGINVTIQDVPFNTWLSQTAKGAANPYQLYYYAWIADYPHPEDWTSLLFSEGATNNNMNYGQNHTTAATAQQAVQKEMSQADVTQDTNQAMSMYNDIEQKLVNDVTIMPIRQSSAFSLRKPCVQGVVDTSMGTTPPNDWSKIYISTASCINATVS